MRATPEPTTNPSVPPPRALSLEEARALLGRFELDAASSIDDVDTELRAQLEALGAELLVDELVDRLRGWIDGVARARDWRADLTAETLIEQVALIARYLAVPAPVEQLWHRLRETTAPAPVTMIAEQSWRDVQPQAADVVRDRATSRRVAFTSEGGIGKSFLLGALHTEQAGTRLWIDAVAPLDDLEQALALGAWATQRKGGDITLFVDAIDQVADPAMLLGAIERGLVACDRAVVYVGTRFATWADIRDRFPRWRTVRLTRWGDDRIRALAEAGRSEPLSADLIDLLRTPLLLDLFLRTFAVGDAVPQGLATRHGVLRAYFERRVYAQTGAGARRGVLDAGVAAVLANATTWRDATDAAHELVSEGVVVNLYGELRFRHALLRDFSAALQLAPRTAEQMAVALRAVTSPIVRNELLRAIFEVQLDPDALRDGTSMEELVRECTRCGLAPGIALGTTDAPTPTLLATMAPIDAGSVLRQAATHARLIDNRAWLRVPSALGGDRPHWFGEAQLQAMASLAEFAFASGDVASPALASTLRTWTWGHRVGGEGPWPITTIGALLVRSAADTTTARWFESIELGDSGLRSRFLEQLRDLGANMQVDSPSLTRALDKIVFGTGSRVLSGGHSLWEVTNLCLSDHDGNPGLLNTRPDVALALLFKLSAERQLAEDRRRPDLLNDPVLSEMLAKLPPPPPDFAEAEGRLRLEPTLSEGDAIGNLVDDAPISDVRAFGYFETLVDEVAQRAVDDMAFAESVATAAVASRSVRARIIALELRGSGTVDDIGVEILRDPRMYHFRYASGALWDAIQSRWAELSPETRVDIQRNILDRARSPLLTFADVGRLAGAIPREDLAPSLRPYLVFLETTGRSTAPTRPARTRVFASSLEDENEDEEAGESGADQALSRFEQLVRTENDQAAADEAIAILRRDLATMATGARDSLWYAIARLVERDEKREQRALDADLARQLFDAAMGAIETRRAGPESWTTLLDLADVCPTYMADDEALAMRTRMIAEVVAGAGENAERDEHAWRALAFVRPIAWFSEGTGGRAVFERWFRDHLQGEGLLVSLRLLRCFPGDRRLDLVRHVLETEDRLNMEEGHAFINEAGRFLATWSIWWEQSWARDLVRRWCEAEVRPGALATAEAWRWFVSGFAWGLQNEVRHVGPSPRIEPGIERFVPLLELAWSAWRTVIDDDSNDSVGWSITAPLADTFTERIPAPDGGWSVRLQRLVPRVIAEGSHNDIFAFQQVNWPNIDAETLAVAADAAIDRADREIVARPPTDWIIAGLIDLLSAIGRHPSVSLEHARRVLDCLQRLGRSTSSAIGAAMAVEREVRARETGDNG